MKSKYSGVREGPIGGKTTVNINETVNNWSLFNLFKGTGNTQTTKKYQLIMDKDIRTDNLGLCQIDSEVDIDRNTSEIKAESGPKMPPSSDMTKSHQSFFFEKQTRDHNRM